MADTLHDLHVFMAQVSDQIASEYNRIYARAADDPGTAGDEGENNWANLLRDWLPSGYHVRTKGRLISHDGTTSPQIDVVVLKPSYPRKLLDGQVWLAGGVAAVFECKTTLTAAHVRASVERAKKFKELFAARTGSPHDELKSPLIYGLLAHSHSWKGPTSSPVENIQRSLDEESDKLNHPRFEIDLLCVADLAVWDHFYIARYDSAWAPQFQESHREAFGGEWGPMTAFVCAKLGAADQIEAFRPVGAFVSKVTQALAWGDPSLRDIADYYRLAQLWGAGAGQMRPWPVSVYSDATCAGILAGRLSNDGGWDNWIISGT